MGTPNFADEILQELIKNFDVVAVFTQEDKKIGRKQVLQAPAVKQTALQNNIACYQPKRLKDCLETLQNLRPDFIVVAAYAKLLSAEILQIAPCINIHASILPKYRGPSPIQTSILNADSLSGLTAMLMNKGLDTGDILAYSLCENFQNSKEAFENLAKIARSFTVDVLQNFDKLAPLKQFSCDFSPTQKISKEDGLINSNNAQKIAQKFKAFFPWPGIYFKSGLKLLDLELLETTSTNKNAEILGLEKNAIILGFESGSLLIKTLQAPSKNAVNAGDYARGKRLKIGDILE